MASGPATLQQILLPGYRMRTNPAPLLIPQAPRKGVSRDIARVELFGLVCQLDYLAGCLVMCP